jgi:hypothetical protein
VVAARGLLVVLYLVVAWLTPLIAARVCWRKGKRGLTWSGVGASALSLILALVGLDRAAPPR